MIDPVIFRIFGWPVHWYGIIVMAGVVVASLIAEREIKRRGENGDTVWDALFWILIPGFIGARLWYVMNDIFGGNTYYIDNPVKILYIWEGGLHFFGGLLFGGIALYYFLKKNNMDLWLFLDSIAPAILIGQAIGRLANFINQELYGHPTELPWGIPIDAQHRLPEFASLSESTRFHPTFAYELILNVLAALLLLWISRQYKDKLKPGTIFTGWLISAGLIRTFIEFFRPDQPRIGESFASYTMVVSFIMAIAGIVMILARYRKLELAAAEEWEEDYHIKPVEKKLRTRGGAGSLTTTEMNEKVSSKKSANAVIEETKPKTATKKVTTSKKTIAKPKAVAKSKTTKLKTTSTKKPTKTTKK
jgi:phosphatidylglycerol---prolipoprotein diacylglyceryl transferase